MELHVIGEIVGAFGVVASLVYVAIQIRNQSRERKLTAVNNLTNQWNVIMGAATDSPETARVVAKGSKDFHALDDIELIQFSGLHNRIFRCFETMYRSHKAGLIDDDLWQGIDNAIRDFMTNPGTREWWKTRVHWFSKGFVTYIEARIDSKLAPAFRYGRAPGGPPFEQASEGAD